MAVYCNNTLIQIPAWVRLQGIGGAQATEFTTQVGRGYIRIVPYEVKLEGLEVCSLHTSLVHSKRDTLRNKMLWVGAVGYCKIAQDYEVEGLEYMGANNLHPNHKSQLTNNGNRGGKECWTRVDIGKRGEVQWQRWAPTLYYEHEKFEHVVTVT